MALFKVIIHKPAMSFNYNRTFVKNLLCLEEEGVRWQRYTRYWVRWRNSLLLLRSHTVYPKKPQPVHETTPNHTGMKTVTTIKANTLNPCKWKHSVSTISFNDAVITGLNKCSGPNKRAGYRSPMSISWYWLCLSDCCKQWLQMTHCYMAFVPRCQALFFHLLFIPHNKHSM